MVNQSPGAFGQIPGQREGWGDGTESGKLEKYGACVALRITMALGGGEGLKRVYLEVKKAKKYEQLIKQSKKIERGLFARHF